MASSIAIVLFIVILTVCYAMSERPHWKGFIEKRLARLEKKVFEESIEFREELRYISSQLEEVKNLELNTTLTGGSPGARMLQATDKPTVVNTCDSIIPIFIRGFQDEKEYVRKSLIGLERKYTQLKSEISRTFEAMKGDMLAELSEIKRLLADETDLNRKQMINMNEQSTNSNATKISLDILSLEFVKLRTEMLSIIEKAKKATCAEECKKNSSQKVCGSWESFSGSCYFISSEISTWTEARDRCIVMNSYLAEVDNLEERDFLLKLATDAEKVNGQFGPWLGATDNDVEGKWKWDHSKRLVAENFEDWAYSEPNGGRGENCLHMYNSKAYHWNDNKCAKQNRFICEKISK